MDRRKACLTGAVPLESTVPLERQRRVCLQAAW